MKKDDPRNFIYRKKKPKKKKEEPLSKIKKEMWQDVSSDPKNKGNAAALAIAGEIVKDIVEDPFNTMADTKLNQCKKKFNDIIRLIICGKNYKEIAKELDLEYHKIMILRSKDEYKPYFDKALTLSAESDQIRAEEVLVDFIESESDNIATAGVSRELSQFFRWRAQRRDQESFGNKQEVKTEVAVTVSNKISDQNEFNTLIEAVKEKKRIADEKARKEAEDNGEYIDYIEQKK